MKAPWIALQVVMMPKDANPIPTVLPGFPGVHVYGTIFGGVILSYIDTAGAIAASREVSQLSGTPGLAFATVAINRVEFKLPVMVGDVVRFETTCERIGRTSITMKIHVVAERGKETLSVTDAEVVYVGIDPKSIDRRPVPLVPNPPPAS